MMITGARTIQPSVDMRRRVLFLEDHLHAVGQRLPQAEQRSPSIADSPRSTECPLDSGPRRSWTQAATRRSSSTNSGAAVIIPPITTTLLSKAIISLVTHGCSRFRQLIHLQIDPVGGTGSAAAAK